MRSTRQVRACGLGWGQGIADMSLAMTFARDPPVPECEAEEETAKPSGAGRDQQRTVGRGPR